MPKYKIKSQRNNNDKLTKKAQKHANPVYKKKQA